jgi:hypothetical protein
MSEQEADKQSGVTRPAAASPSVAQPGISGEAGTPSPRRGVPRRLLGADFLIALFLFVVFLAGFVAARDWPADSRLFPDMVTVAGMALAVLKMALALRPPAMKVDAGTRVGDVQLTDEDDEEEEALEYVFSSASRRDWLGVLTWAAAFFAGLQIVGTVPTVLVFTVLYLLREARTSIVVAVVYAALLAGLLFGATELLGIGLPRGILFN